MRYRSFLSGLLAAVFLAACQSAGAPRSLPLAPDAETFAEEDAPLSDAENDASTAQTLWSTAKRCKESAGEECTPPSMNARMVPIFAAPFQAQIYYPGAFAAADLEKLKTNGKAEWEARHWCGGVLIAPGWVLTAAHCVDADLVRRGYGVRLGQGDISNPEGQVYKIARFFYPPGYVAPADGGIPYTDDIALLKLEKRAADVSWGAFSHGSHFEFERLALLVQGAAESPDGKRILAWSRDGSVSVWSADSGALITRFEAGEGLAGAMFVSASRILVWGKGAALIDAGGAQKRIDVLAPQNSVYDAVWLTRENAVLTSDSSGRAAVWDAVTGAARREFDLRASVYKLNLSPDQSRLYVDDNGGAPLVRVFDLASGEPLSAEGDPMAAAHQLARTGTLVTGRDGKLRVLNSDGPALKVLDPAGKTLSQSESGDFIIGSVALGDGVHAASWSMDNKIRLIDTISGRVLSVLDHERFIAGVLPVMGGAELASWGPDGEVIVWTIKTGKIRTRMNLGNYVQTVRSSADGKRLIAWNAQGEAVVAELSGAAKMRRLRHAETAGQTISFISYLKDPDAIEPGRAVTVYGWGKSRNVNGTKPVPVLQAVGLDILSAEECMKQGGWDAGKIHDRVFCARRQNAKTCRGDSGGPVIEDNRLAGIVSWGKTRCAPDGAPGVYTNVARYADWIEQTMQANTR